MRPICLVLVAAICFPTFTKVSAATAEEDAIAQYRAYVTAVRAGKSEDVMKLIEPVPESCKAVLDARLKQAIAVEAMKKEMIAQFGPAKTGDDAWNIGGLPYDDAMKSLKGVGQQGDMILLITTEPQGTAAWMIRRNGKWIVPAGLVLDLEPGKPWVEPDAAARDATIKYADTITKAAEAVLKRLRNKEFKKPADASTAFGEELKKAEGH